DEAARRVAAGLLALGIAPGERLMIRLPNTSDYALLFFGAIAAGIVPLPVSPQLTAAEADVLLADSGAAAVALAGGRPGRVRRRPARPANRARRAADDPAPQHQRLRPALLRRHRRRHRAAAGLPAAHRRRGGCPARRFRRRRGGAGGRPAGAGGRRPDPGRG